MPIERDFDVSFVARLTAEEKQIQQSYRPVIGVHKWFARRPGALFRSLLLAEFSNRAPLSEGYWQGQSLPGLTIADPFMGGGTTLFEANRLGCDVLGADVNPLAWWVVRQELAAVDRRVFRTEAEAVIGEVQGRIGHLYETRCTPGHEPATVKYFLWVKRQRCDGCGAAFDLFPGYLVAKDERHPALVVHCPGCERLGEVAALRPGTPATCPHCRKVFDWERGPAARNRYRCPACGHGGRYPSGSPEAGPPRHRLFGIEYHCRRCRPGHQGRFFKTPDADDLARTAEAGALLAAHPDLGLPADAIQDGDETRRLRRWGYRHFREMFTERQLVALGLLLRRIGQVENPEARHALATVFSDSLRYQNLLARYDSWALKCQDVFSVHGFPVGLVQCENNVLGIPGVGSGSFCHFVEKYDRAKAYCEAPFETRRTAGRKERVRTAGERIEARLVDGLGEVRGGRTARLHCGSVADLEIADGSIDAVFTDPPYFDNVQYAELADFCYAWLRLLLGHEFPEFEGRSTRSSRELTGNATAGRGLAQFTEGLSAVFATTTRGLKPGGPFVFTYHHNDSLAYVPVITATLDAGLACTATLPCPAEMAASLHISGTKSSTVDSVIVCRRPPLAEPIPEVAAAAIDATLEAWLRADQAALARGGTRCTRADLRCLAFGHLSRVAQNRLRAGWDARTDIGVKMRRAAGTLSELIAATGCERRVTAVLETGAGASAAEAGARPRPRRSPEHREGRRERPPASSG